MKLNTKAMESPLGLRVTFETAPVVKFHIAAKLPDPTDPYRIDVTITLPEGQEENWVEGTNAAFQRVQNGNRWSVRIDYPNAIRYFGLNQLNELDRKNPGFAMHLYNVPVSELAATANAMKKNPYTEQAFARLYYRQRKNRGEEASRDGTVCHGNISGPTEPDAV